MQPAFRSQKQVLLRFMRGEELVSVLEEFCNKQKILGAWVKGLGAVDEVEISYYDLKDRNYKRQGFCGEFELLNLTGNIAPKEGKPFLHAHATFSRPAFPEPVRFYCSRLKPGLSADQTTKPDYGYCIKRHAAPS